MQIPHSATILVALLLLLNGCASTSSEAELKAAAKQAEESHDSAFAEMLREGDKAITNRDYDAAIAFYREAARHKETTALWMRVGFAYKQKGQPGTAARAYQKAIGIDAKEANAWHALGELYLTQRQYEHARHHLQKALEINPDSWRTLESLGVVDDLTEHGDQAKLHYRKSLSINNQSPSVWTNYGYSHYLSNNFKQAENAYRRALELDSTFQRAWANYGLVAARLGKYSEALKRLIRVQKEAVAYNDIGYIAMLNGDFDEAQHLLDQAIAVSPTYYEQAQENLKQLRTKRSSARLNAITKPRDTGTYEPGTSAPEKTNLLSRPTSDIASATSQATATVHSGDSETKRITAPAPVQQAVESNAAKPTPKQDTTRYKSNTSQISLTQCPGSEWPSACRLCVNRSDPEECFRDALAARKAYRPK